MLDNNLVYGEPRSIVTPFMRSFLSTYMVSIRELDHSKVSFVYVKAMSNDHAYDVAKQIVEPKGYIVKDVTNPGDELYGLTSTEVSPYFGGKYLNTLPEPTHYA
jgi:hypothetical protein